MWTDKNRAKYDRDKSRVRTARFLSERQVFLRNRPSWQVAMASALGRGHYWTHGDWLVVLHARGIHSHANQMTEERCQPLPVGFRQWRLEKGVDICAQMSSIAGPEQHH